MMIILAAILVAAFCNSVLIERVRLILPLVELRRRARSGHDKRAAALYKMMAYGPSLQLALWLKGTLSAVVLIIWAARTSWWLAVVAGLLISYVALAGRSNKELAGWQVRYAALVAPLGAKALGWLQPVVGRLAGPVVGRGRPHTGLYEKEDLLDLFKRQARQPDNRLSEAQLKAARGALSFGDKTVGQVMTSRTKAKWVLASENVGPMLMDELHKTGQTRFAVVKQISKAAHPEVIGSLYIQDLLDHLEDGGHIRDLMHPGVNSINETQKLSDALAEFIKTGNYLLTVTNNFEETVGTITLEHVLGQIFGHQPPAEEAPQKEHSQQPESKVE
jgi:CBS domain containing-hemolysin-like protein